MRKYNYKCKSQGETRQFDSCEHKNNLGYYKKPENTFKKDTDSKSVCQRHRSLSKDNLSKLGENLIKSGYEFENALTKLLDAESRKINAIMKKYDENNGNNNVITKDEILLLNDQLKSSLYSIKEIEETMKLKIIIGLFLLDRGKESVEYYNQGISEYYNFICNNIQKDEEKNEFKKEKFNEVYQNKNECNLGKDEEETIEGLDQEYYGLQYLLDMLNKKEENIEERKFK